MKKLLAICSILFTVCATFTACGTGDESYMSNGSSSEELVTKDKSVGDRVDSAIDGIGDAGKDIIGGATDAADDIEDGLEGDNNRDSSTDAHDDDDENSTTTDNNDR